MKRSKGLSRSGAWLTLISSLVISCTPTAVKPPEPPTVASSLRVSLTEVESHRIHQRAAPLPPELIEASQADAWHRSLEPEESLESLESYRAEVAQTARELEHAIANVSEWLQDSVPTSGAYDRPTMIGNPYFRIEAVGSLLTGQIRRRSLGAPPASEPRKAATLFSVSEQEDGIHLAVGNIDVRFPLLLKMDEDQRSQQRAVALAFASGDAPGVRHYLGSFKAAAQADVERHKQILAGVGALLRHAESVQVSIDLINDGPSAVSVHGAFQLRCERSAGATDVWLLEAVSSTAAGSACTIPEAGASSSGPLLITVPRNAPISVRARPLQMEAASLSRDPTEVSGRCVVIATTLDEAIVASSSVLVGRELRARWLRDKLTSGR